MISTPENPQSTPHAKSLLEDRGERYLRNHGIDVAMNRYRDLGVISHLAMLVFGSDKLFDADMQSLGTRFVEAYVKSSRTYSGFVASIAHLQHLDLTNAQSAAILISLVDEARFAKLVDHLNAYEVFVHLTENNNLNPGSIAHALIRGIGYLLSDEELTRIDIVSKPLSEGVATYRQ